MSSVERPSDPPVDRWATTEQFVRHSVGPTRRFRSAISAEQRPVLSNSGIAMTVEERVAHSDDHHVSALHHEGKKMSPAACCGFAHLASRPGAARVISRRSNDARASNCRGSKRQSRNECTTRSARVSRQAKMLSQRKKKGETKFPRR